MSLLLLALFTKLAVVHHFFFFVSSLAFLPIVLLATFADDLTAPTESPLCNDIVARLDRLSKDLLEVIYRFSTLQCRQADKNKAADYMGEKFFELVTNTDCDSHSVTQNIRTDCEKLNEDLESFNTIWASILQSMEESCFYKC
ncbi:hypothetical protein L596_008940 [Steinernema carpocapsae]|uniref:Uncharacterized protein n=1 Tax=Steinernema carpocapsae TaxID=34508 RepID=A0A4U5PER1_STECR|nr:hypothetical protein L596_008940 [Steinernema carpocapsae]